MVYKSCLFLEIIAQPCSQLVTGAAPGTPWRECGYSRALWGTQRGSSTLAVPSCVLTISCTCEAHPVHSPCIRQMPAEPWTPGNYSACFNTASCCEGRVTALPLSYIERDSQSDPEARKRCLSWLRSSCLALVSASLETAFNAVPL